MNKIIILLLICPVFLKAQKITENTYDKQDSSRVIKTNELVSNDVKVHCEYIDLQKYGLNHPIIIIPFVSFFLMEEVMLSWEMIHS
ncbi:MAG: hypothetical protein IPP73_18515 [Chitinophagaceae bacterium]|nr:hypothetical protein [Chitinophagaceae bacterium]